MQGSDPAPGRSATPLLTAAQFRKRIRWLVFHAWNFPPIVGLGFILLIGVLTPEQMLGILTTPLEPAYILGWLVFALWYLPRSVQPVADWLDGKPGSSAEAAVRAVRRFPLRFWATFLIYLAVAPASVIFAAELYTGFVATPMDWFRIELVALIVSIVVGLPIFFLIFDIFGRALGGVALTRPIITIRTRVFLIGALVPLLIDTMLVQYYWTRTGYFTAETFGVWLALELIAIGGSLVFAHSFGQSLAPLQALIGAPRPLPEAHLTALAPQSTDELGLLTSDYRALLQEQRQHGEFLELSNRLLRSAGSEADTSAVLNNVVELSRQAIGADLVFLIVHDPVANELVGVAQSGAEYRAEGHYRLALTDQSLAVWCFTQCETAVVNDATQDPRVSPGLRQRFGVLSTITAPLRLGKEVLGVLMVAHTARAHRYGSHEQALVEGLAREAAFALHAQRLRAGREHATQALRTSQQRLQFQQRALVRLAEQQVNAVVDITQVLRATVEVVADTLEVERASIWGYDRIKHELICLDLFESATRRHTHGNVLHEKEYPVYFAALLGNQPIVAEDAGVHPQTREFSAAYLTPLGIGAMLDAPIHRGGQAIGVLCCEHVGDRRAWTTDEQNFSSAVASFVSLCLELHDHHRTAKELEKHREQLEDRVEARTQELAAANRELEAFSYSVSHDLRAPLRAVNGFALALGEDCSAQLNDEGREYLARIINATRHMGVLIDNLLQLSRVGRSVLNPQAVDVTAQARAIVDDLRASAPGRQVEVKIASLPTAYADPILLHAVLDNLLGNAWKYTSRCENAHIEFDAIEQNGETVYRIRDNGAGFDMQYAGKLFGAFQRLHKAEDFPGSGIGLATVQRIIHRHGGRVWAEGKVGEGASFFFTLGA